MIKCKLGDIATILISNVDKKSKDNQQEVVLCNFVDVYRNWAITKNLAKNFMIATASTSEIEKFTLKKGYVALTKDSETKDDIGISTYIADDVENMVLGYHNALVIPNEEMANGKYINAFLHSSTAKRYFELNASGSGQRYTLTLDSLENIPILLPNLEIQRKIGDIFSNIDRKIEVNNAINNNLEQQAMALYDYYFTQFDFPNEENKPYSKTNGKFAWNDELKRNIPANWTVVSLSEIINILSGFAFSSDVYVEQGKYPLYTIKNVQDSGIIANVDNYIDVLPTNMPNYCLLKSGDILTSLTGNVGRVGVVYQDNALLNQRVSKLVPKDLSLYPFILYTMKSKLIRKKIETIAIGSSQANISPLDIASLKIPFNKEIAQLFSSKTQQIVDKYIANMKENSILIEMRNWLLPLLMNGQATIDE